jgi:hypothetical protein
VEIAQIRVLAFSGAGAGGDFLGIYMWIHDGGVYGLIYGCLWCYNAEIYCINPIYCPIGSMYGIYIYMSMLTLGVYWWDPCHHIWHTSIQFTLDISKDSRCLWTTYRTYRTPKRHSTLRRAA